MTSFRVRCATAPLVEPHAPQAAPYARRGLGTPGPTALRRLRRRVGFAATAAIGLAVLVSGCGGGGTPDSSTPPSTAAIAAAECGSLEDAVTAVTTAHPEIGLAVGSIPTQDQIDVMRDLVDGLEAVDLTSSDLSDLRRAMVVASQSIIDRGSAQEPLTDDDQGAFAGVLTAASDYCGAITGTPVVSAPVPTGSPVSTGTTTPAGSPTPSVPPTAPATPSSTTPSASLPSASAA